MEAKLHKTEPNLIEGRKQEGNYKILCFEWILNYSIAKSMENVKSHRRKVYDTENPSNTNSNTSKCLRNHKLTTWEDTWKYRNFLNSKM